MGAGKRVAQIAAATSAAALATSGYWNDWFQGSHWPPFALATLGFVGSIGGIEIGDTVHAKRRSLLMQQILDQPWTALPAKDPSVRLNVMVCDWRLRLPIRGLSMVSSLGFTDQHLDRQMRLSRGTGIASLAVESENWVMGIRIAEKVAGKEGFRSYVRSGREGGQAVSGKKRHPVTDIDHGLSPEQRRDTTNLRFILSYPVRRVESENGGTEAVGSIIGVVNLDSTTINPYVKLSSAGEIEDFTDITQELTKTTMKQLATIAGMVFG